MKKVQFALLIFILLLTISSCSAIKSVLKAEKDKNPVKSKFIAVDTPANVINASPDNHAGQESAIIVSVPSNDEIYINGERFAMESVSEKLDSLFKKDSSERQMIYLNGSFSNEYGSIVRTLDLVRKTNPDNIGLFVRPSAKTDAPFNILKIKVPPEPKMEDGDKKPNPYALVINMGKDDKIKLNGEDTNDEGIKSKLGQIFKERESKGIFREGTNEIEKTVTIKSVRSNNYGEVVKIIDVVTGTGASVVYLQVDDLDM